jgi:membrane-associated protease RseP (regulator of RpoE activity)
MKNRALVLLSAMALSTAGLRAAPPANPSAHQIELLVVQLGDPDPGAREKASRTLKEIGKPALPALKEASTSPDLEIRSRSLELIRRIEIPGVPGGPVNPNAPHAIAVKITGVLGGSIVEMTEASGRRVKVEETADGINMTITAKEDGKDVTATFKAKDPQDLKDQSPDAFALYERAGQWGGGGRLVLQGGVNGGLQIQGMAVHVPDPFALLRRQLDTAMKEANLPDDKRKAVTDALDTVSGLSAATVLETGEQKDERLKKLFEASDVLREKIAGLKVNAEDVLPPPAKVRLGVQIEATTPLDPRGQHIIIARIVPGSRGEKLGLKVGDTLVKVGGKEVNTQPELREALSASKPPLVIECLRDGQDLKLTETDKDAKP